MSKASEARTANAQKRIWAEIQIARKLNGCTCKLHKGMTWDELRKLGAGCTRPDWICTVLDKYRRLVGQPPLEVENE